MAGMRVKNDLVLRAARRERTERTPVWLMRQAGRFDPQYRAIRRRCGMELEDLFCTPDLAAEISLLPRRLGVDAIILFQDILTPLAPMGRRFVFRPGPLLDRPVRCRADVESLHPYDVLQELPFIPETLGLIKGELDGELPLLGFAGAPLTLALFLIEGQSPHADGTHAQALMRADPRSMHALLDCLAEVTGDYLAMQIEAGADAVQLFESAADLVTRGQYAEFAEPYHRNIFAKLGGRVPTILFAKDQPAVDLMAESGADVLSIASCVDLTMAMQQYGDRVAFQGNVDNRLLLSDTPQEIDDAVEACIRAGDHKGHILNLGHGILKDTPFENVCRFIEAARKTVIDQAQSAETTTNAQRR